MRVQNTFDIAVFDSGLSDTINHILRQSGIVSPLVNSIKKQIKGRALTPHPTYHQHADMIKEFLVTT